MRILMQNKISLDHFKIIRIKIFAMGSFAYDLKGRDLHSAQRERIRKVEKRKFFNFCIKQKNIISKK